MIWGQKVKIKVTVEKKIFPAIDRVAGMQLARCLATLVEGLVSVSEKSWMISVSSLTES